MIEIQKKILEECLKSRFPFVHKVKRFENLEIPSETKRSLTFFCFNFFPKLLMFM